MFGVSLLMWLPDDIVSSIAAFTPDPRPLLLTCHAFYAVFTGLPDIAYWCSGRDPKFLLPKHVPEVCDITLAEIIHADNVNVFAALHDRDKVEFYWRHVIVADAADICEFLLAKYPVRLWKQYHVGPKCLRFLSQEDARDNLGHPGEYTIGSWLACGMERQYLPSDILARHVPPTLDYLLADHYAAYCSYVHPRPPYNLSAFVKGRPSVNSLLLYLRAYNKPVTLLVIAVAVGRLGSAGIAKLLRIYNDTVSSVINSQSYFAGTCATRDTLAAYGAKYIGIPPIPIVRFNPESAGLYLPERADDIRKLLAADKTFLYTTELAGTCAKHGINIMPSRLTFAICRTVIEMVDQIRVDCSLLAHVPKRMDTPEFINFRALFSYLHEFAAAPEYTSTIQILKNIANFNTRVVHTSGVCGYSN